MRDSVVNDGNQSRARLFYRPRNQMRPDVRHQQYERVDSVPAKAARLFAQAANAPSAQECPNTATKGIDRLEGIAKAQEIVKAIILA